jgi:hypothetical protein
MTIAWLLGMYVPAFDSAIATTPKGHKSARNLALAVGTLGTATGIAALGRFRPAAVIAGAGAALSALALRWQLQRLFTDEPSYTLEQKIGDLEIRRYDSRVEAHARLDTADFDAAREKGFRRLADYIFRGNAKHEKLAMTAPVTIAPRGSTHTIAFVMPPERTLADLPRPNSPRVNLVEVPVRRFAVLRYRGKYTAESFDKHSLRLRQLASEAGLTARGLPIFAGFDPPSTLPVLRRTEVWLELA